MVNMRSRYQRLVAHRVLLLGALERVHAKVGELRRAQLREGPLPDREAFGFLLQERDFPVLVAQGGDAAIVGPVDELLARPIALAAQSRSES